MALFSPSDLEVKILSRPDKKISFVNFQALGLIQNVSCVFDMIRC